MKLATETSAVLFSLTLHSEFDNMAAIRAYFDDMYFAN